MLHSFVHFWRIFLSSRDLWRVKLPLFLKLNCTKIPQNTRHENGVVWHGIWTYGVHIATVVCTDIRRAIGWARVVGVRSLILVTTRSNEVMLPISYKSALLNLKLNIFPKVVMRSTGDKVIFIIWSGGFVMWFAARFSGERAKEEQKDKERKYVDVYDVRKKSFCLRP